MLLKLMPSTLLVLAVKLHYGRHGAQHLNYGIMSSGVLT